MGKKQKRSAETSHEDAHPAPPGKKQRTSKAGSTDDSGVTSGRGRADFEAYYQVQQIVSSAEFPHLIETLLRPLPTTFRTVGTQSESKVVRDHIEAMAQADTQLSPLAWYPQRRAWELKASKHAISKQDDMLALKSFLVPATDCGLIIRQEAVSMIPTLLLEVSPHHRVLDMCAAPGSKTSQILDALHSDDAAHATRVCPTGLVIANDSNAKRCFLLAHQMKRLQSPCLIVTNHDASMFPTIYLKNSASPLAMGKPMLFDRILCDVPCSGDGTIRKNPKALRNWTPRNGNALHLLQIRILSRAIELLARGGVVVYSTCSLNPVENEAVIASVLLKFSGSVELVDVSSKLPQLKRRSGLSTWKVQDSTSRFVTDATSSISTDDWPVTASMFPPAAQSLKSPLRLDRCWRLVPQDQDTGGFFVAVLKKTNAVGFADKVVDLMQQKQKHRQQQLSHGSSQIAQMIEQAEAEQALHDEKVAKYRRVMQRFDFIEPPFEPVEAAQLTRIREVYGLNNKVLIDQLCVKADAGKKRTICLVSSNVKEIFTNSDLAKLLIVSSSFKLMTSGAATEKCMYRLRAEGASVLQQQMTRRIVSVPLKDMKLMLGQECVSLSMLSPELCAQTALLLPGSLLLYVAEKNLAFVGWLAPTTLAVQACKEDRNAFSLIL